MAARMRGGGEATAVVRKGPWTLEEDLVLVSYITEHGEGAWDNLARAAGTDRSIAF
jgi:transcription factor MYB, plant